ncbi:hypothetical protein SYNTR_0863 [Candidatus Syntrophocurvum alkaliphilum]|uniref:Transcriptional regulator, PadR family n=2 Tax=Candidatus Syntrophocurvum alkaliphilum TaxID=2293317 RepID=A0A6I6DDZ1_9FIRM|nr:hypothetical protein SYNTR_0863 [Candidatus Syntrophocurvum alkaliphilum]
MDLPTYGYNMIKKCFADFTPANPIINEGRLYSTLKQLDREGMVEREIRAQQDMPDQKIIKITPQGIAEFNEWLESEIDEEGHSKYDFFNQYPFLTKVNFFMFLSDADKLKKLKQQLEISDMRLRHFNEAREKMVQKKVDVNRTKIIEYGIDVEKLKIKWLEQFILELEQNMHKNEGGQT